MKFTKKQPLNILKPGDFIDDIFVVKIKKGVSQYAGGYSFQLLLSDSSGKTIDYKYWGGPDEGKVRALFDSIKSDSVVHVQGKFGSYNNKPQITTNEPHIIEALEPDQYEGDFIKKAKRDTEEMYTQLLEIIETIQNEQLKKLLQTIFEDENIKKRFKIHPGAIEIHHNWTGGLLQHTLEVTKYCELSVNLHPNLNRDFMLTGALLHDIGKLEELAVTSRIKGTKKGQLIGHITLGFNFLAKKMDELNLDEDLKEKLLHIIVSHHGKNEFGSPKQPMFPEAVAIYYADELSSKIAEMIEFIEHNKDTTEDDFMYHYRKGINILLK